MVVIKVGTAPLDCNKTEEVVITPEISVIRLSVITYPFIYQPSYDACISVPDYLRKGIIFHVNKLTRVQ